MSSQRVSSTHILLHSTPISHFVDGPRSNNSSTALSPPTLTTTTSVYQSDIPVSARLPQRRYTSKLKHSSFSTVHFHVHHIAHRVMAVESPFVIRLLLLPLFALPEWRTDCVKPLLPGTHAVVSTTPQIAQLFNGHHITGNSSGPPICHCGERMEEELGTLWRSSNIQRPLTYAMGITSTHFHEFQYIDVPPTHIGTPVSTQILTLSTDLTNNSNNNDDTFCESRSSHSNHGSSSETAN